MSMIVFPLTQGFCIHEGVYMTVAELIEKLKEFNPDMRFITYADYDESGHGDLNRLWESEVYDEDGNETGEKVVYLDFDWHGEPQYIDEDIDSSGL